METLEALQDSARVEAWARIQSHLETHYHSPEIPAAKILFACVAAHTIKDHPPAWLLAIAPSGSLKTVMLESLRGLPRVRFVDEVTGQTFISGKLDTQGRTRKCPASYLHRIGSDGLLVSADFGTMLSTDRRVLAKVLGQMRRIYDGHFSREFGSDENLEERGWEGRLTFLAGATPDIDSHHAIFQSLGERFIRARWGRAGGVEAGMRAISQRQDAPVELCELVDALLRPILDQGSARSPELPESVSRRIANLGELVALARSHVPRDSYNREVTGEPAPEGNTRLPQELAQVGRGWALIEGRNSVSEGDYELIKLAAFNSVPPARLAVLDCLLRGKSPYTLALPKASINRVIEDLEAVGLLQEGKLSTATVDLLNEANIGEFPQSVYR